MPSEPFESETPPDRIPLINLSLDAEQERDRILHKARELLDLAARHLAGLRQSKGETEETARVECGDMIRAAEILFTPEPDRTLPWLSDFAQSIPFYSCFISYTDKDDAFSQRLYNDLQAAGVRCWRWREDAKWGQSIWGSVDEAVRLYDKLVVICSKHSLRAPPVIREIERALQKEDDLVREGKPGEVLFPITLDTFLFETWQHGRKADVVTKYVGDFAKWKQPAAYDAALKRLIRDLEAGPAGMNKR